MVLSALSIFDKAETLGTIISLLKSWKSEYAGSISQDKVGQFSGRIVGSYTCLEYIRPLPTVFSLAPPQHTVPVTSALGTCDAVQVIDISISDAG